MRSSGKNISLNINVVERSTSAHDCFHSLKPDGCCLCGKSRNRLLVRGTETDLWYFVKNCLNKIAGSAPNQKSEFFRGENTLFEAELKFCIFTVRKTHIIERSFRTILFHCTQRLHSAGISSSSSHPVIRSLVTVGGPYYLLIAWIPGF